MRSREMKQSADFRLEQQAGRTIIVLVGDWTAQEMGRAGERLAVALKATPNIALNVGRLGRFDSAGAYSLVQASRATLQAEGLASRPELQAMLAFVAEAMSSAPPAARPRTPDAFYALLVRCGHAVEHLYAEMFQAFAFYGRLLASIGRVIVQPGRIRLAPTVALMERAGLEALPIIAATNFFVGATIGFLGEDLLNQFGAQVYSVELVGIGVLREFGVLVTAVILAGRSASSFAAELGAMKMNQEVDAMQVMGVDPFEALVLPRFLAMLTMTPLLTFVAMMSGLIGGLVVIWTVVGLSPAFFAERMLENVGVSNFYIGMAKAPVMAVVIAAIGCRQGLEVGGDVEQLGRRVTAAVVQALFWIIIIDAVFALLFLSLGQ